VPKPIPRQALDPDRIIETVRALQERIDLQFPDSGLGAQCGKLLDIAEHAREQSEWISRPVIWLRLVTALVVGGLVLAVGSIAYGMLTSQALRDAVNGIPGDSGVFFEAVQAVDAGVNELVLLSLVLFFFTSIEGRMKRRKALGAIHELRSMAHIIDMHQLAKDPTWLRHPPNSAVIDGSALTIPQLTRYLDNSTDMLSLTGKIAALYVQDFQDPVALSAVNEIELLTTSLSGKIWQKLSLLDAEASREERIGGAG
jgi:hypothetical protein